MVSGPYFSILVPTKGRPELAAGCVRSILSQRHPSFELLLLDQTPSDATREAALEAAAGSSRFRHVPVEGSGRSRALNAGIPLARGEWIVMTDDDCEPEPGWLEALEAVTRRAGDRAAIVARVKPGPVGPGKAVPPATIEDPEPRDYAGRVDRDLVYPNFAVPRVAFETIGRFDLRLGVGTPIPGGEDNDFGYRLLRAGWRILYRPGPAVVHSAWRSPEERASLKRAYGIGQGAFYRKHLGRDPFIAWRFARDLFRTARAAGGAIVRGRLDDGRGHLAYLVGLFVGVRRMGRLIAAGDRGGLA